MKTHTYIAEYFQVTTALGVFCISVFFAYLLHLGCEAPVLQIEKLIFDKPMKALTTDKKTPVVSEVLHEKSQLWNIWLLQFGYACVFVLSFQFL